MKLINWIIGLFKPVCQNEKPHVHQFEKIFEFENDVQKTTYTTCVHCGEEKNETVWK